MTVSRNKDRARRVGLRCRAIAAAATVIAFSLFTAPLQAQEAESLPLDVTVSLDATLGADNVVTLVASVTPAFLVEPTEQSGFQFRSWEPEDAGWSPWQTVDLKPVLWSPIHGNGPYKFQARAWTYRKVGGEWRALVSDPTDVVTVTPQ